MQSHATTGWGLRDGPAVRAGGGSSLGRGWGRGAGGAGRQGCGRLPVDLQRDEVFAREATVLRIWAVAEAVRVNPIVRAMTGDQGGAVVAQGDGALVRQRQGFGEPLAVVLRAERVRRLGARLLPGDQGVVVWGQHGV